MSDETFHELISRVRAGDPAAARELLRQYEPMVRRIARFRLADDRLRAAFDSMDVCQSVLGSFFVRAAHGEYDLHGPEDLARLLAAMARNKLATQARRQAASKRDYRRGVTVELDADGFAGSDPSPSSVNTRMANRDGLRWANPLSAARTRPPDVVVPLRAACVARIVRYLPPTASDMVLRHPGD